MAKCYKQHDLSENENNWSWNCDGKHRPGGCKSVNDNILRTNKRFTCGSCNFNLCEKCYMNEEPIKVEEAKFYIEKYMSNNKTTLDLLEEDESDDDQFIPMYDDPSKKKDTNNGPSYMEFDFRRGVSNWPDSIELISNEKAVGIIKKAHEDTFNAKKKKDESDNKASNSNTSYSYSSWNNNNDANEVKVDISNPDTSISEAEFMDLIDGSTALILKAGYRLKLKIGDLLKGGDEKKEARQKEEKRMKKRKAKFFNNNNGGGASNALVGFGNDDMLLDFGDLQWGDFKMMKTYINEYTITMDIMVMGEDLPREGISLYQGQLVYGEEDKKTGKITTKQSDGDCILNYQGTVGSFAEYGDPKKGRVVPGVWSRLVIAVQCGSSGAPGEMRVWIDDHNAVCINEVEIAANERFALDSESFYLFSSEKASMMPGNIAIRYIRIENKSCSDREIKMNLSRNHVI
jgi:hypothetical protein